MSLDQINLVACYKHPLILALKQDNFQFIKDYHTHGVYILYPFKITPLHIAVQLNSSYEIVFYLYKRYQNIQTTNGIIAYRLDWHQKYPFLISEIGKNMLFLTVKSKGDYVPYMQDCGKCALNNKSLQHYIKSIQNSYTDPYYMKLLSYLQNSRDLLVDIQDNFDVQNIIISRKIDSQICQDNLLKVYIDDDSLSIKIQQNLQFAIGKQLIDAMNSFFKFTYGITYSNVYLQIIYNFQNGTFWTIENISRNVYFALTHNITQLTFSAIRCDFVVLNTIENQQNVVFMEQSQDFIKKYQIYKKGFEVFWNYEQQFLNQEEEIGIKFHNILKSSLKQIVSQLIFNTYKGSLINGLFDNNFSSYQIITAKFIFYEQEKHKNVLYTFNSESELFDLMITLLENNETYQIYNNKICKITDVNNDDVISKQIFTYFKRSYHEIFSLEKTFSKRVIIENYQLKSLELLQQFIYSTDFQSQDYSNFLDYSINSIFQTKLVHMAVLEQFKEIPVPLSIIKILNQEIIFTDHTKLTSQSHYLQLPLQTFAKNQNSNIKLQNNKSIFVYNSIIYFFDVKIDVQLPVIDLTIDLEKFNKERQTMMFAYKNYHIIKELDVLDFEKLLMSSTTLKFKDSPRISENEHETLVQLNHSLRMEVNYKNRKIQAMRGVCQRAQIVLSCLKQDAYNKLIGESVDKQSLINIIQKQRAIRNQLIQSIQDKQTQLIIKRISK